MSPASKPGGEIGLAAHTQHSHPCLQARQGWVLPGIHELNQQVSSRPLGLLGGAPLGILERELDSIELDPRRDRVPGRPRHGGNEGPGLQEQRVEQRALASVWGAHQPYGGRCRQSISEASVGQDALCAPGQDGIQRAPGVPAQELVDGGDQSVDVTVSRTGPCPAGAEACGCRSMQRLTAVHGRASPPPQSPPRGLQQRRLDPGLHTRTSVHMELHAGDHPEGDHIVENFTTHTQSRTEETLGIGPRHGSALRIDQRDVLKVGARWSRPQLQHGHGTLAPRSEQTHVGHRAQPASVVRADRSLSAHARIPRWTRAASQRPVEE